MTTPLKVLSINQFFYPDSYGGVERVAHETLRRLVERGHSVQLVGQRLRSEPPDVETVDGIVVNRYGSIDNSRKFGGRTLAALFGARGVLRRLARTGDFDVVLAHHYFPYYAYAGVTGAPRTPEVMTFHASYWQELRLEGADRNIGKPLESVLFGGLSRRAEASCLKRADSVIVLSDFSREQLGSYYPFALGKVVKIPGGVDLERFRPADDRARLRERLGLPGDRQVLFTARRLVPRMGLENLVDAFGGVLDSHPDTLLVIAGKGRLREPLLERGRELGLADRLRLVGFVEDDELVSYYQAADLFVLPSLAFEGFGMVTLEALACGTPAVGTPIGATPELLKPLAGQLVLGGTDAVAIRRGLSAVLEWLSDEEAARALRQQCRRYVERRYGWDVSVDRLEELLLELHSRGPRR
ncbi:MAG: glycosyltransferase [Candidatus Eisenbacteria bacterium]|nr:glycosyltransferase [Candidatus Eisenbacteria bacterium]